MEYKDYYEVLGVDRSASQDAIKKAYRTLARKHHPDTNQGDPASEAKFREINEAYEVLSDPEKREKYDRFGAQWQQYEGAGGRPEDFDWGPWQPQGEGRYTHRTLTPEELEELFGTRGGHSEFFESLFGGFGRRGAGRGHGDPDFHFRHQPTPAQEHTVQLTLQEAFHGTDRILQWEDGRKVSAKIPPGVRSGSLVRLKGQGPAGVAGGPPGDLYLKIQVVPDPRFQRDGDDLRVRRAVDVFTLLLGGSLQVESVDRTVKLDIPQATPNGRVFRLRGLGMPHLQEPGRRGDLLVTVEASLPTSLSERERQLIQEWQSVRQHTGDAA